MGHDTAQIARVEGPAGLAIGSRRPAEIALSILAQITAVRNGIGEQAAAAHARTIDD
jgi:xanthine dehydrogenase accessory factor